MNDIILENRNGKILVSSLDVAEKFGKRHDSILRDIDNLISDSTKVWSEMLGMKHYKVLEKLEGTKDGKTKGIIDILNDNHLVVVDYFIKSSYVDAKGEERPCYLVTKLGCDFLANIFTSEKGVLFTAKYVKRFDEMEQELKNPYKLSTTYKEALVQLLEKVEENEKLIEENNHKQEVINGFTDDVDIYKKRVIINRICKRRAGTQIDIRNYTSVLEKLFILI